MKPSWDTAPSWAKWLAKDGDGQWHWYENEPRWNDWNDEWTPAGGDFMSADCVIAETSKEPRP